MDIEFRDQIELNEHELQRDTRLQHTQLNQLMEHDRLMGKTSMPNTGSEEYVNMAIYAENTENESVAGILREN